MFLCKVKSLGYDSIKQYLSGIKYHYICANYGDILSGKPRLDLTLQGIMKSRRHAARAIKREPITANLLAGMCRLLLAGIFGEFIDKLMAAVLTTGFFAALRCGEFTIDRAASFDSKRHLCLGDVVFTKQDNKDMVKINLKSSKTDVRGKGVELFVFATGGPICPYKHLMDYVRVRNRLTCDPNSHLFIMPSRDPLTRAVYLNHLRLLLRGVGVNDKMFSGHSLRKGMATESCKKQIPDSVINVLGRWHSDVYKLYIHTPNSIIADAHSKLASV